MTRAWRRLAGVNPLRGIPGHRAVGLGLRAGHLAAVGTLLGGHVFGVDPARLVPWLLAGILTGMALVVLEVARTAAWLTTVKGLAVAVKLAVLSTALVLPDHGAGIFFAALVFAAVTAHMPGRFRHRQLVPAWRASTAGSRPRSPGLPTA